MQSRSRSAAVPVQARACSSAGIGQRLQQHICRGEPCAGGAAVVEPGLRSLEQRAPAATAAGQLQSHAGRSDGGRCCGAAGRRAAGARGPRLPAHALRRHAGPAGCKAGRCVNPLFFCKHAAHWGCAVQQRGMQAACVRCQANQHSCFRTPLASEVVSCFLLSSPAAPVAARWRRVRAARVVECTAGAVRFGQHSARPVPTDSALYGSPVSFSPFACACA